MPIEFHGTTWPSMGDQIRANNYLKYLRLYRGEHRIVFNVQPRKYQVLRYIVANFPGMLARLSADMLFGEESDYMIADDEAQQTDLDAIIESNNLYLLAWEAAAGCAALGDAILKVRWGPRRANAEPEAIIEEVPAAIYYPELSPDNARAVLSVSLAWQKSDATGQKFLRVEEHEPGIIRHKLYLLSGTQVGDQVALTTFPEYATLKEEEQTGLEWIPVFHIPNMRLGTEHFGTSDFTDLITLFEAINNRITQIDEVLDQHVAPKVTVPQGLVDTEGKVSLEQLGDVIELGPEQQPPQYITWTAHLEAAEKQIDRLIETLFTISDTSPSMLGLDKYGVAESGRALRLRMLRTESKMQRKKRNFDPALRDVLYTALIYTHNNRAGVTWTPARPTIDWADGIPVDQVEQTEIIVQQRAAGVISRETAIRLLQGPDAVEEELARLDTEEENTARFTGTTTDQGGPRSTGDTEEADNKSSTNPGQDEE